MFFVCRREYHIIDLAGAKYTMTTYTSLNEVVKKIMATVGPVDGVQVVYAHQVGDGCTVVFKHKNFDAIIATARMWLKNTVVYEGEDNSPRVPVVFGELTFGQRVDNISLQKKEEVAAAEPASSSGI